MRLRLRPNSWATSAGRSIAFDSSIPPPLSDPRVRAARGTLRLRSRTVATDAVADRGMGEAQVKKGQRVPRSAKRPIGAKVAVENPILRRARGKLRVPR